MLRMVVKPRPSRKHLRCGLQRMRRRTRLSKKAHYMRYGTGVRAQTSKLDFLKAMQGTGGIMMLIAKNLGVLRTTVKHLLERPDWRDVREEWEQIIDEAIDEAEECVLGVVRDIKVDPAVRTLNARWLLTKGRRERFGEEVKHVVAGDKNNPVRHQHLHANLVDIEKLRGVSPAAKREFLLALDAEQTDKEAAELVIAGAVSGGVV